jgi:hypothetical protein
MKELDSNSSGCILAEKDSDAVFVFNELFFKISGNVSKDIMFAEICDSFNRIYGSLFPNNAFEYNNFIVDFLNNYFKEKSKQISNDFNHVLTFINFCINVFKKSVKEFEANAKDVNSLRSSVNGDVSEIFSSENVFKSYQDLVTSSADRNLTFQRGSVSLKNVLR